MPPFNIFLIYFFTYFYHYIMFHIIFNMYNSRSIFVQMYYAINHLEQNDKTPQKGSKNTPKTPQGPKVCNLGPICRTAKDGIHRQGHGVLHGSWVVKFRKEVKTLIFSPFFFPIPLPSILSSIYNPTHSHNLP